MLPVNDKSEVLTERSNNNENNVTKPHSLLLQAA
jgi:hypothetical protein